MSKKSKCRFGAEFKMTVVPEELNEHSMLEELPKKFKIHHNRITTWKNGFPVNASVVFERSKSGLVSVF